MKYLKPFNEAKDPEIIELINTYLAYIKDDNFDVDIAYHPSVNCYNIHISKGKAFNWSDVEDSVVPMIEYLRTKGFTIEDEELYGEVKLDVRCWDSSFRPSIEELDRTNHKNILKIKIKLIAP